MRDKLDWRRELETRLLEYENTTMTASVGMFPGRGPSEIFLRAGKTGSPLEAMAHDLGVLFSIAVQHGVPVAAIRRALMKLPDGRGAGPLGKLLDSLDQEGCLGP